MVAAVLLCLNHVHKKFCQIIGIRGGTDLVVHNRRRSPLLSNPQHGSNEILSIDTENPGNADSEKLLYQLFHSQLAFILGLPINV